MVERRQKLTTAITACLLVLAVVGIVLGVHILTETFIKAVVFAVIGLWVVAMAL